MACNLAILLVKFHILIHRHLCENISVMVRLCKYLTHLTQLMIQIPDLESWKSGECLKSGNDHHIRVGYLIGIFCNDEASAADLCHYAFVAVRSLRLAAEVNGWISCIFGAWGATAQDLQRRARRCVEHWRHTVCDAGVSLQSLSIKIWIWTWCYFLKCFKARNHFTPRDYSTRIGSHHFCSTALQLNPRCPRQPLISSISAEWRSCDQKCTF